MTYVIHSDSLIYNKNNSVDAQHFSRMLEFPKLLSTRLLLGSPVLILQKRQGKRQCQFAPPQMDSQEEFQWDSP